MTTSLSDLPRTRPSPTKSNPFARPRTIEPTTFSRGALLPGRSPVKASDAAGCSVIIGGGNGGGGGEPPAAQASPALTNPLATPSDRARTKQAWRLLWRGGLEVGPDGWRLDGITLFAQLSFPVAGTPRANPFAPLTPSDAASPLGAGLSLPTADTDLCLSFESMRGRKYLQVRGVVPLSDEDIEADDSGVQMSITSPLLAAFFTGILCRSPKLSPQGKTSTGVVIGLGDEGVDHNNSSTVIVYGQKQATEATEPTLRLCVGRRRVVPPPREKKVRPGEPLPRAPLFQERMGKRPIPPIPQRSLSRASSVATLYARSQPAGTSEGALLPPDPITKRLSPGRRGEKRPRREHDPRDDDERQRKHGRVVPQRLEVPERGDGGPRSAPLERQEEDIFGRRSGSLAPSVRASSVVQGPRANSVASQRHGGSTRAASVARQSEAGGVHDDDEVTAAAGGSSTLRPKRPRVPQRVLDNKATIRKQTLLLLEARGYSREHDMFKDVFGMATKGTYFALRALMETGPVDKGTVQDIIGRHLDMYVPGPDASEEGRPVVVKAEEEVAGAEATDVDDDGEADREGAYEPPSVDPPTSDAHRVMRTPSPQIQQWD